MFPAAVVTARVGAAATSIDNDFAAVVTCPCQTTATTLHATLLLRSALGAPQSQAVCVRANGFASPTAAGARDGSRIHIDVVARIARSRPATWTTESLLDLSLILTILTDFPTIPLLSCM